MAKRKKTFVPAEEVPRFHSEAEEAAWWDSHQDLTAEWFERARAKGALTTIEDALKQVGVKAPSKTISIRFPEEDLRAARQQAQKKGLPYQTYLKMLLHEALERGKTA